jgi:hypothetical protein
MSTRFDAYHVGTPRHATAESLEKYVPADTDAIMLQFGVQHAMRELVPHQLPGAEFGRLWVNSRTGSAGSWFHRKVTARILCRYGRLRMETNRLEEEMNRLLDWLFINRRDIPCAILSPNPIVCAGWADPEVLDSVAARLLTTAEGRGIQVIDFRSTLMRVAEGREGEFFGANGYDLRRPGHRVVADAVLEWLLPLWTGAEKQQPKATTSW